MHHKKILWGTLLFGITLITPFTALADSPTPTPPPQITRTAQTNPLRTSKPSQTLVKPKTHSFQDVWTLILKHHRARASHFSPELIACLMWEESGFRLVENPQSGALGFGQVLPRTLYGINKRYKTKFTRTQLLTSPEASVEATVLALEVAWNWKKEKVGALFAYAGGVRNFNAVKKWVTAEPHMLQAQFPYTSPPQIENVSTTDQFITAMHMCSQPGFNPQVLFD
jgi:hypothetical protein